jgi:hypothetical protein
VADDPKLRHAGRPCDECPFRRDTPPGQFPASRYEQLRDDTVGGPGREVPLGGLIFACHMTLEGREIACAGWLTVCGVEHLGVRYAVATGRLDPAALRPRSDWPELFDTYEEMAAAQAAPDEDWDDGRAARRCDTRRDTGSDVGSEG